MKRHLLVIPSWYPSEYNPANGGFFRDQCLALKQLGIQVGVIYPELRSLRSFRLSSLRANHFQTVVQDDDGIPTLRFQGWNVPGRLQLPIWHACATRLFDLYVQRFGQPDLIHAHGAQTAGNAAAVIKSRRNIPYVMTEHSSGFLRGLFTNRQRPYLESAFLEADRLLAVSRALVQAVGPFAGERKNEIEVIPNLVDTDFFCLPNTAPPPKPFRIACIALLNQNKQVDILLRAFAAAFDPSDSVVLDIGGEGPERVKLECLAGELGLSQQVRFMGLLDRAAVRTTMQSSHLFVLPSKRETFGLVCVEAMACGVPVLATNSGGPEEILIAEVGRLVSPGDIQEMSSALRQFAAEGPLEDPRRWRLRSYAEERFGSRSIAKRLLKIYEEVLDSN